MRVRLLRIALGATVFLGWFAFAFAPRSEVSAGPASLDDYPQPPAALTGNLLTDSEVLALPTQLAVAGEQLVAVDRYAERAIHLISTRTGELLRSLGPSGEGPGEFRVARFVDPDPGSPSRFWVFDAGTARLTLVDPTRWDAERPDERRIISLHSDDLVLNPVWVDSDRLLATGLFDRARLGLFDRAGMPLGQVGPLPRAGGKRLDVPSPVLQQAFMGQLKARPDRRRLALAERYGGAIEIYGADGRLIARAAGPFDFAPHFTVVNRKYGPVMANDETTRLGYVDLATTSDRVYALFSGRTAAGFPERESYAEYVHIFDWSGRYLGALHLDSEVAAIAVDERTGVLYAARHLPVPAILAYSLPDAPPG